MNGYNSPINNTLNYSRKEKNHTKSPINSSNNQTTPSIMADTATNAELANTKTNDITLLYFENITDAGLAHLKALRTITLSDWTTHTITDVGLAYLKSFSTVNIDAALCTRRAT